MVSTFYRKLLLLVIFATVAANLANAATISLRERLTKKSTIEAELGKPIDIDIFIEPENAERLSGISVYLTFDDNFLEPIDADTTIPGIQPIKTGIALPQTWRKIDNDTHGDPGNNLPKYQIDFAYLSIVGDQRLTTAGTVGTIQFHLLRSTTSTTITFDTDRPNSRMTETTVEIDQNQIQREFTEKNNINLSIVGGPIFSTEFPPIQFLTGETNDSLQLDNFVSDSNDANKKLIWSATQQEKISVDINPETHVITFGAVENWVGTEEILLTVTDPKGNSANKLTKVEVMSAPKIAPLPQVRTKINTDKPPIDLNQFVSDFDAPNLVGLTWSASYDETLLTLRLDNSVLTLRGEIEQFDTPIEFTATDSDGNSDSATMLVSVLPNVIGPVIQKIPDIVATIDGQFIVPEIPLKLSHYVLDVDFEPEQMQWGNETTNNVIFNFDQETHIPTFSSRNGWIGEEIVTLFALNPNLHSGKTTLKVTVVALGAPPILSEIPPIKLAVNDDAPVPPKWKEKIVDLKDFVFDHNSTAIEIQWEVSGNDKIEANIALDGLATITATEPTIETLKITAIDPDGKWDATTFEVTAVNAEPPQLDPLPSFHLKSDETIDTLELDNFISDNFTPIDKIEWTAEGFELANLEVEISEERKISFSLDPDWHGTETVQLTATNELGLTQLAAIEITRTAPPIVTFGSERIELGERWNITLELDQHVSDADTPKSELDWNVKPSLPVLVRLDKVARNVTIETPENSAGEYEIEFTATDSDGNIATQIYPIRVVAYPKSPPQLAKIDDISFANNKFFTLDLNNFLSDVDTQLERITLIHEGGGQIKVELDDKNLMKLSADADFTGTENITLTAIDPDGQKESRTISVTVNLPPQSPEISSELPELSIGATEILAGKTLTLELYDFVEDLDTDKSALTWKIDSPSDIVASIDSANVAEFSFSDETLGKRTLTLTVTDPEGESDSAELKIAVIDDYPKAPIIKGFPKRITIKCGRPDLKLELDLYVSDQDSSMESLQWELSSDPLNLTVYIDPLTHVVDFTPIEGFIGFEEEVSFTVSDTDNLEATAKVMLDVPAPNPNARSPLIAQPQPIEIEPDQNYSLNLSQLVSDKKSPNDNLHWESSGGKNLTFEIDQETKIGTVKISSASFRGTEIIELTATNSECKSDTTILQITVQEPFDLVPPELEVFLLPNPIQPEFITVTIKASEALQNPPKLRLNNRLIPVNGTGADRVWTVVEIVPSGQNVKAQAEGVDLAGGTDRKGLTGKVEKEFKIELLNSAPIINTEFSVKIGVFPNPVSISDRLKLQFFVEPNAKLIVSIYGAKGELVKTIDSENITLSNADKFIRLTHWNLNNNLGESVSRGIYFVHAIGSIDSEIRTASAKILVK